MQVVLPEPFGPTRPRISPGMHMEADAVERAEAAEALDQLLDPQQRRAAAWIQGTSIPQRLKQRHQPVGQEQHQPHDQHAVDQLEILRRR